MQDYILYAHVGFGILMILFILMQDKGVGFGSAIGGVGGGGFYATQRGAAKVIHIMTIIFAILFFLAALLYIISEYLTGLVS